MVELERGDELCRDRGRVGRTVGRSEERGERLQTTELYPCFTRIEETRKIPDTLAPSRVLGTRNEKFGEATGNIPGDRVLFPIGDLMLPTEPRRMFVLSHFYVVSRFGWVKKCDFDLGLGVEKISWWFGWGGDRGLWWVATGSVLWGPVDV